MTLLVDISIESKMERIWLDLLIKITPFVLESVLERLSTPISLPRYLGTWIGFSYIYLSVRSATRCKVDDIIYQLVVEPPWRTSMAFLTPTGARIPYETAQVAMLGHTCGSRICKHIDR